MVLNPKDQEYFNSSEINWLTFLKYTSTEETSLDPKDINNPLIGDPLSPMTSFDDTEIIVEGSYDWSATYLARWLLTPNLITKFQDDIQDWAPVILEMKRQYNANNEIKIDIDEKTVNLSSFGTEVVDFFERSINIESATDTQKFAYVDDFPIFSTKHVALLHFSRNIAHDNISGMSEIVKSPWEFEKKPSSKNLFHVFNDFNNDGIDEVSGNEFNSKWVAASGVTGGDSYGISEYIFSNSFELVDDPINAGSFNLYISGQAHVTFDVQPWVAFGNVFGDTTNVETRNGEGGSPALYTRLSYWNDTNFDPLGADDVFDSQNIRLKAHGHGGNDTFISGPQDDEFHGGDGIDVVSYEKSTSGIALNLEYGRGFSGYAAHDTNFEKLFEIENVIGSGFNDIIVGSNVENNIQGSNGNDEIFGLGGNDTLRGGGGNDTLEGGADDDFLDGGDGSKDTAVFSGKKDGYSVELNADGDYTVIGKTQFSVISDGLDTLTNIEKIRFSDGTFDIADLAMKAPVGEESSELVDGSGAKIGTVTVGAPTQDQGTQIEFNLNLSTSGIGTQYRVALIIDVSGSMDGSSITDAKAAYVDLIDYLKDQGIADVTEFAIIPFQSSAALYEGLSADEAIVRINSLNAGGGTSFGPAIQRGLEFFDGAKAGQSNITYFLSDGQGYGANDALQSVADVRAFGIGGGADISSLNIIDSNNAVALSSASDLAASFTESEIKTADVDKVEMILNGNLVETIAGDQFTDNGATGLNYSGTINGLDVSDADTLEAKVYFKDTSIAAQSVTFEIGDGVTDAAGSDGDDNIAFSLSQRAVDAGGGTDMVLANDLDNTVIKISGNGVIKTFGGNDIVQAGDNRTSGLDRVIDGGDGTDTVVYVGDFSEYTVSRTGGLIKVGTATDSLSNVEFLQFDDVKVRTSDLSVVQILSANIAEVTENDKGTQITFTVNLDAASSSDVTFDYTTANGTAEAGRDFTAANGTITLLAGETEKIITVDIAGDIIFEGDETFELQLTNANGAVFDGGNSTYSIAGIIKNDDDANQVETGSTGDDVINTGKGSDQINSGAGNDVVNANLGNDVVVDGLGNNNLNGEGGADAIVALSGLNTATGGSESDYLAGGFQADNLNGGDGNDVLRGDAGDFLGGSDVLTGGADNDFLMGGRGADTFVFNTNDDADVIAAFDVTDMGYGPLSGYTATATEADFQSGVDKIQLAGFTTVDASNVMSSVIDGTDGAVFSAEGTSITFYDVTADKLDADDFIFV